MLLMSHPSWVCGLKLFNRRLHMLQLLSHPSWVCGLKHWYAITFAKPICHTLRGCVDWNTQSYWVQRTEQVTPFVGVWIETISKSLAFLWTTVTPFVGVWIETAEWVVFKQIDASHTLRGCVDWNNAVLQPKNIFASHTLRGCVDWNLCCSA